MKLKDIVKHIDFALSAIISDDLQRKAERNLLLSHYFDVSAQKIFTHPDLELSQNDAFEAALNARIQDRIPIQYLIGESTFYGLTFKVTPAVLIPRPETEILVEHALNFAKTLPQPQILDVGTGSGCIAITLKKHLPNAVVTAVDISPDALEIAKQNAQHHQTDIHFQESDALTNVLNSTFDLIVANPPYIDSQDKNTLTPEVLKEPHSALFSPNNPQLLYKKWLQQATSCLKVKGRLFFEFGIEQSTWIQEIADDLALNTALIYDYASIPRILEGIKQC